MGVFSTDMKISSITESDILGFWLREKIFVRAEIVGANVSLSFTGTVAKYSGTELVLSRQPDEMSISLFCGTYNVFEPSADQDISTGWAPYRRVVQITTDGGAQCTLFELREPPIT